MVGQSQASPPVTIHVGYRPIDRPWGGANNFVRALVGELQRQTRYKLTESIEDECDILFMNQLSIGPGRRARFRSVRRIRQARPTLRDRLRGRRTGAKRLIVRAVNLNAHAFTMGLRNALLGSARDREVIRLLNFADMVIFQSAYQREVFQRGGYTGQPGVVIHNGADIAFWNPSMQIRPDRTVLRIASSTASARATKRHDLIAAISEVSNVEVTHFGNWPDGVSSKRVRLQGMRTREEMAQAYRELDYFLHPAIKDPCPNAVFEAICSGLPIIYHPGAGSSSEIVAANGLALDDEDLSGTIDRARSSREMLVSNVARTRDYYRIDRAAREYLAVFDAVAGELRAAGHPAESGD